MKTKIIRFSKAILFCLIIVLSGCEKQEDDTGTNSLMTIRKSFDKNDFSKIIKIDYEVDWNSMKKEFSPDLNSEVFEFDIRTNIISPVNSRHKSIYYKFGNDTYLAESTVNSRHKSIYYKLIAFQRNGKYTFYIAKFADNPKNTSLSPSFLKSDNYSGKIYILNKSEEIVLAKKYSNGSFVGYIDVSNDMGSISSLLQQDCHIETVNHYSEYYVTVGGQTYYNTAYLGTTFERVCHSNGTDGSDDGGVSDQYEDVEANPCDKIKAQTSNPDYKDRLDTLKGKQVQKQSLVFRKTGTDYSLL
jgi:hypothetical protein